MRYGILTALVIAMAVSVGISEDKTVTTPAPGDAAPSMDAAMAEMMKYAAPAENHKHLEAMVGNFTAEVSMWMAPGAEPTKSTGELKNEMILGGRYLQGTYTGTFMGQPFHGVSLFGFNNYTQQYFNLWIDDMSTTAMVSHGTGTPDGKEITLAGDFDCPQTKSLHTMRQVVKVIDADHHVFEMFDKEPGKEEHKVMEIKYTRVK